MAYVTLNAEQLERAVAEAKAKYLKAADERRVDSSKLFNEYSTLLYRYRSLKRELKDGCG